MQHPGNASQPTSLRGEGRGGEGGGGEGRGVRGHWTRGEGPSTPPYPTFRAVGADPGSIGGPERAVGGPAHNWERDWESTYLCKTAQYHFSRRPGSVYHSSETPGLK